MNRPVVSLRHRMVVVFGLLLTASSADGQREWLPEPAVEALAEQLVEGFGRANVAPEATEEERMRAARNGIGQIAQRLETMGVEGVLGVAPVFEGLEVPRTGAPIVDAIAAFGTCSLPLHFELAADDGERLYVAVGEVAVVVISAYLRTAFLRQGGSDEDLARLLDTEEFSEFSTKVQQEEELRARVNSACAGPLGMLMP